MNTRTDIFASWFTCLDELKTPGIQIGVDKTIQDLCTRYLGHASLAKGRAGRRYMRTSTASRPAGGPDKLLIPIERSKRGSK